MIKAEMGRSHRSPGHKPRHVGSSATSLRPLTFTVLIVWLGLFQHGYAQELRAGAARAKITPEELGWLGCGSSRPRPIGFGIRRSTRWVARSRAFGRPDSRSGVARPGSA
jgi:hypothetical protein